MTECSSLINIYDLINEVHLNKYPLEYLQQTVIKRQIEVLNIDCLFLYQLIHKFNQFSVCYQPTILIYLHLGQYSRVRDRLLDQNQICISKIGNINNLVNELLNLVKLILDKNANSLDRIKRIYDALIEKISFYNPDDDLIYETRRLMEIQLSNWISQDQLANLKASRINQKKTKFDRRTKTGKMSNYKETESYPPAQDWEDLVSLKNGTSPALQRQPSMWSERFSQNENSQSYKQKLKQQFYFIKQFTFDHLTKMVEYSERSQIQKKIILNCYLSWSHQSKRVVQIDYISRIQMELTNQLKICFPNIQMARKNFRGIKFKNQYANKVNGLTDRFPIIRNNSENKGDQQQINQQDEQFSNEQRQLFEPIDKLIRMPNTGGAKEQISDVEEMKIYQNSEGQ